MKSSITQIIKEYISVIPEKRFQCQLSIKDNAVTGHYYSKGLINRKKKDIGDLPYISKFDLIDSLSKQKNKSGLSPYAFDLTFDNSGKFEYEIHYPDLTFRNLEEVEKDAVGFYPNYIYINISETLISQLDDYSLNTMIPTHIDEARKILNFDSDVEYSKLISEEFYLFMLNLRVESEINHGRFDRLFAVFSDSPSSLLVDIYRSFRLLNNQKWLSLFTEAIQLYSHFHSNVDEARKVLNIPSIEKTTESDIMSRYYSIEPTLDSIRSEYIRKHPDKFTKVLINGS